MHSVNRLFLVMTCLSLIACGGKKTDAPKAKPTEETAEAAPAPETLEETPKKEDAPKVEAEPLDEEDARTVLVGIWRVDLKSLGTAPVANDSMEPDEADALAVERQAMAMTAFEFSPEGRFTRFMGQQIIRGKYKIEKATGNLLHIVTTIGGRQNKMRVKVTEDNLVVKQTGMPTLTLERGPPKIMGVAP